MKSLQVYYKLVLKITFTQQLQDQAERSPDWQSLHLFFKYMLLFPTFEGWKPKLFYDYIISIL